MHEQLADPVPAGRVRYYHGRLRIRAQLAQDAILARGVFAPNINFMGDEIREVKYG